MNKVIRLFAATAATAALIVGVSASIVQAFEVQQCDAPVPDTIRCRNANSTLQALPSALDTSASVGLEAGSQFTHKVKFEAGLNNTQGTLLKSNGDKVVECSRASDTTIDANFGVTRVCNTNTRVLGAVYRVSIN